MSHCFLVWFVGCPSDCRRSRLLWIKRLTTRFDQCRKTRSHTAAPHALRLTVDNQPVRSIHAPAAAVWHCNRNVTHVYDVTWRNRLIKQCEVFMSSGPQTSAFIQFLFVEKKKWLYSLSSSRSVHAGSLVRWVCALLKCPDVIVASSFSKSASRCDAAAFCRYGLSHRGHSTLLTPPANIISFLALVT